MASAAAQHYKSKPTELLLIATHIFIAYRVQSPCCACTGQAD